LRLELVVQVAVRVVEQERGLELHVNFPEFTLATMLPIVIVIVAASVLKIELFSTRFKARDRELLSNLKIDVFSPRVDASVREPLRDLNSEVFSAKLEAELSDPLSDLNIEVILERVEAEVSDPLRF